MNQHRWQVAAGPATALAIGGLLLAGCGSASSASSAAPGPASTTARSSTVSASRSQGSGGPGTAAGSTLFPIAVGEKWVYADHLGSLGSSTTTNTVAAIKPASGGNLVTLTDTSNVLGTAKTTKLTYMFYSNGSIGVPFTQLAGGKVAIESGSIVWPSASALASGQAHTSVLSIAVKTGGQILHEKVHVTVKSGGTASVTVPAGTYQATIVDQNMSETVFGHAFSFAVRTWLAPGVGPVKDELVGDSSFFPHTVEELTSFTK